ncbi:MAG: type II toxin-antitoxin system PrlF family antitoxin [Flavobacteriales bacterium]
MFSQITSTLTDRYQTTVPESVRRALKLGKRDKIQYRIDHNGTVSLERVPDQPADDPVLGQFLQFLADDLAEKPQQIQSLSAQQLQHVQQLTQAVELDLDAPLSADDE